MTTYEEGQAALMRLSRAPERTRGMASAKSEEDLQASLAAVNRELQDARRQLGFVLEVVNELKPASPCSGRHWCPACCWVRLTVSADFSMAAHQAGCLWSELTRLTNTV
jgi:hypothetical protein